MTFLKLKTFIFTIFPLVFRLHKLRVKLLISSSIDQSQMITTIIIIIIAMVSLDLSRDFSIELKIR